MQLRNMSSIYRPQPVGAHDFLLTPGKNYVTRYDTYSGIGIFVECRRFVISSSKDSSKELTSWYLGINADNEVTSHEVERISTSPTQFYHISDGEPQFMYCSNSQRWPNYDIDVDQFDRMYTYETYIKYRDQSHMLEIGNKKGKDNSETYRYNPTTTFRCDPVAIRTGNKTIFWGWSDITRLDLSRVKPDFFKNHHHFFDYSMISDFSETLFPDVLYLHHNWIYKFEVILTPDAFSPVKRALIMSEKEPLLYRMAEFHDSAADTMSDTIFFIGTFKTPLSKTPFTTMLTVNMKDKSVSLNRDFGHNGIIHDFKVHVDCPPIVDLNAKLAVVLSFAQPEILVICLKTFKHLKIDLRCWVTESFLERWERDKRGLCMTFLAYFGKLIFLPRYSQVTQNESCVDVKTETPMGSVLNWKLLKNGVVLPFLDDKRQNHGKPQRQRS